MKQTLILAALIAAVAILLTACGGGDYEPEDDAVPPQRPVDCQAAPAVCR